jgi:hypothetical protein
MVCFMDCGCAPLCGYAHMPGSIVVVPLLTFSYVILRDVGDDALLSVRKVVY